MPIVQRFLKKISISFLFITFLAVSNVFAQQSEKEFLDKGFEYLLGKNYDEAITQVSKAIELNPSVKNYMFRASIYLDAGKYDQVIADCNKVLEIDPKYSGVYVYRIQAYFYKKDYDKAWADVHKAKDLGQQIDPAVYIALVKATGRTE